jgi:hypothetical protein
MSFNFITALLTSDAPSYAIALFRIPYTDLKYWVYVNSLWQNYWDFHDANKLYSIQCKVNNSSNIILKRDDEVIISRQRIGHSK